MTAAEITVAPGVGKTPFGTLRGPEANLKDKAEAVQITLNVELPEPSLIAGLLFALGASLAAGRSSSAEDVATIGLGPSQAGNKHSRKPATRKEVLVATAVISGSHPPHQEKRPPAATPGGNHQLEPRVGPGGVKIQLGERDREQRSQQRVCRQRLLKKISAITQASRP